jgi:hypothetical protein
MSRVDELFEEYRAAFRSRQGSDPKPYLDQLTGTDRRELEALIDGFLARGARPRYTPEAFAAVRTSPLAQRVQASLSEAWPELLPRARDEAGILRSDLVTRLAEALGVAPKRDKVERYYHQMEKGLLDPSGVSDRVLAALAEIVGVSKERLRAAARPITPPPAAGPTFARTASLPPAQVLSRSLDDLPAPPEPDEVDELFRGG